VSSTVAKFILMSSAVATGSGGQPCQMVVQKNLDKASPHLWLATVTAQPITSIKIDLVTVGGTPYVAYEIQLDTVQIFPRTI
jgi:type VI protein secretion system component Hcp